MRITRYLSLAAAMLAATLAGAAQHSGQDGIALVCGGIGQDESSRMLALQPQHALTVIFATREGAYLADVNTRVDEPQSGLTVERMCGPIGQLDVPVAGRYRVTATFEGTTLERWVELRPTGGQRLVLHW